MSYTYYNNGGSELSERFNKLFGKEGDIAVYVSSGKYWGLKLLVYILILFTIIIVFSVAVTATSRIFEGDVSLNKTS